jgi:hypothetical protein
MYKKPLNASNSLNYKSKSCRNAILLVKEPLNFCILKESKVRLGLIYFLLLIFCSVSLQAQIHTDAPRNRQSIKVGFGLVGLLAVDEYMQGERFERVASLPVSVAYHYRLGKRWSTEVYFGYEFEKFSGTLTRFEGPTHSIVAGLNLNYHPFARYCPPWLDPFVGVSSYYYSSGLRQDSKSVISPAFRVGSNFKISEKIGFATVLGVQVALLEFHFSYHF